MKQKASKKILGKTTVSPSNNSYTGRGVPRSLKKRGGGNLKSIKSSLFKINQVKSSNLKSIKSSQVYLKVKPEEPDILKSKNGHHARKCPIFRPKTSEEQRKGQHALRLCFISSYEYHLDLICAIAYLPGYAPEWLLLIFKQIRFYNKAIFCGTQYIWQIATRSMLANNRYLQLAD